MSLTINPDILEQEVIELILKEEGSKTLVLYNDDFNTFQFVAECLMKICKHYQEQAEQCTYIVHYKGKCPVKHGTYKKLKPMCEALLEKGLTAKIED